jgi:hypothetical protein
VIRGVAAGVRAGGTRLLAGRACEDTDERSGRISPGLDVAQEIAVSAVEHSVELRVGKLASAGGVAGCHRESLPPR